MTRPKCRQCGRRRQSLKWGKCKECQRRTKA
jgi:hypothetical protein